METFERITLTHPRTLRIRLPRLKANLSDKTAVTVDQQGWKDVVVLDDDDWSEIVVRFDHQATDQFPYMYHCHILEHEDRGMMGQFTVT